MTLNKFGKIRHVLVVAVPLLAGDFGMASFLRAKAKGTSLDGPGQEVEARARGRARSTDPVRQRLELRRHAALRRERTLDEAGAAKQKKNVPDTLDDIRAEPGLENISELVPALLSHPDNGLTQLCRLPQNMYKLKYLDGLTRAEKKQLDLVFEAAQEKAQEKYEKADKFFVSPQAVETSSLVQDVGASLDGSSALSMMNLLKPSIPAVSWDGRSPLRPEQADAYVAQKTIEDLLFLRDCDPTGAEVRKALRVSPLMRRAAADAFAAHRRETDNHDDASSLRNPFGF